MPIEDDLKVSLRRAAASAEPSHHAWDQLQVRHERLPAVAPRNRVGAGLLAATVAVAGVLLVVRAFGFGQNDLLDPAPVPAAGLEGTEWILERLDAEEMTAGRALVLRFSEGEFGAESECNTNMGRYEISGASLVTSGGVQTTAGCEGAAAERQRIVFDVIRSSPTIELGGATLTLTSDAGTLRYVRHPCSFLTDAQVAAATGDEVSSSGLVPPERMRVPGGPRPCIYEVPGRYASVVVHVVPASLEEFHALRDRDPGSNVTIPVEGIGEEAFIQGEALISVFLGDHYLGIGLQHGAGTPGVRRVLEELARAAIGQADVSSVEPIPDDALGIQVERSAEAISVTVSFGDERIEAQAIETPGDELEYPSRDLGVPLPAGTPIAVRSAGDDVKVSVRRLMDAGPGELVDRSVRRLPEELVVLDEPGEIAISVHFAYPDGVGELGFTVQVEDPRPAAVDGLVDVPQGWTELSEPPEVRSWNSAKVWTGSELLTWGGYVYTGFSDEVARNDGFAWEPISGATRELAPSPLAARVHAASAWTGRELLVWGGSLEKSFGGPYSDGAAYDAAADTWRSIASAPISARVPLWHVWTGRELLVWGDQDDVDVTDGAAYDPAADAWRPIASSPQGTGARRYGRAPR